MTPNKRWGRSTLASARGLWNRFLFSERMLYFVVASAIAANAAALMTDSSWALYLFAAVLAVFAGITLAVGTYILGYASFAPVLDRLRAGTVDSRIDTSSFRRASSLNHETFRV